MVLFFQLLALTLGSLVVCYGLGTALRRLTGAARSEEFFFEAFLRLLAGAVLLAAGHALVQTHGDTILLPVLLLLLGGLHLLRRPETGAPAPPVVPPGLGAPAVFLGIGALVFGGQYLVLYDPGSPFLQTPFQDYVFYSRLTLPLNQLGVEANSLEVIFPQFQTVQPYHYLEIWLNALLVHLTGLPSVWVFFVSAASVLTTVCTVGFAAIYAHCGLQRGWAVLFALATLTVTGTVWPYLNQIPLVYNGSVLAHQLLATNPKLAAVYVFETLGVLLLLRKQFDAAGLAFAALPLVFISTAPAAGAGVAGAALYAWASKRLTFRQASRLGLPTLAALLWGGLFYTLHPAPYQWPGSGHFAALAAYLPAWDKPRLLLNIGAGVLLVYGVYFAGYFGLAGGVLAWRRRLAALTADGVLLAWAAATVAGAVLMRTIGHRFLDGYQFFSNPVTPLTGVLVAVLLGRGLAGATRRWHLAVFAGLMALAAISVWGVRSVPGDKMHNTRFSAAFLRQVGPVLEGLPNRGGYLLADEDYENAFMMNADAYTAGTYVADFKNDYLLLSLSALVPDRLETDPRFFRNAAQAAQDQQSSTLYRLAELQRLTHRPIAPDSIPVALVYRARLAFVCAAPRAVLPSSLRGLVQARYHDSLSGETLYVLKPQAAWKPMRWQWHDSKP